jgi:hypothetical protein
METAQFFQQNGQSDVTQREPQDIINAYVKINSKCIINLM